MQLRLPPSDLPIRVAHPIARDVLRAQTPKIAKIKRFLKKTYKKLSKAWKPEILGLGGSQKRISRESRWFWCFLVEKYAFYEAK